MAIIQGLTNSFRRELLEATHNFATDTFKIALYSESANLSPLTTAYTTAGEIVYDAYTAGGATLTGVSITTQGDTACVDWTGAVTWTGLIEARGALIYNASKANRSVYVLDFGATRKGFYSFSLQMPTPGEYTSLIRIK